MIIFEDLLDFIIIFLFTRIKVIVIIERVNFFNAFSVIFMIIFNSVIRFNVIIVNFMII